MHLKYAEYGGHGRENYRLQAEEDVRRGGQDTGKSGFIKSVIRLYIANRFQQYELMASTLGSLAKHKEPKNSRSNNTNTKILAGAAATAANTKADGANGQGGGRSGAEGEGAADKEAADEAAIASSPILGAHPTIIRMGAHLGGENLLKVALSV